MANDIRAFSPKQGRLLTWYMAASSQHDKTGVIADGAIRSGKTIAMSLAFVLWAMMGFDGQNFIMAGKTVGSFRRNVLEVLKSLLADLPVKVAVNDRRADNLLVVHAFGHSNNFYYFGGKDERSQDMVQGITAAGAFFDEVALMPESFVNQATARCSVSGSKWWFNCNPDGPFHWFKKNWIDRAGEKGLLYLHFTMEDNPGLDEEIKDRYRKQYTGIFYKRYIEGLWAVAEGIIYDMFSEQRNVLPCAALPGEESYVSCDYGTQNATVFLLWRKYRGRWFCVREYYYSGRDNARQKTDSQYADDLSAFLAGEKPKRIVVDPSAASFIAELKRRGYKVEKAVNDVAEGIRLTSTCLSAGKICFDPGCAMTLKEFAVYAWDPKAAARGEDRPIKENDHAMDAVRYMVSTVVMKRRAALNRSVRGGL